MTSPTVVGVAVAALAAALPGAQLEVNFDLAAVAALVTAGAGAIGTTRLLRPNRDKIIGEATSHATTALDAALARYERDNVELRQREDRLEDALDTALRELRDKETRIAELERELGLERYERERLTRRVADLEARAG